VMHPAAKLLVLAANAAEQECGDGTNLTVTFAAELLHQAMELLKEGVHTSDVVKGYQMAQEKFVAILENLSCWSVSDIRDTTQLTRAILPIISAKQIGFESQIAAAIAGACVQVMPADATKFDIDCIRVAKVIGGSAVSTSFVKGMVITRDVYGLEKYKKKPRVVVFGVGIEMTSTETKGTVLLKSAAELLDYTKGEERQMENFVKDLVAAQVDVVIANGTIQDIAMHYLNKYKILIIKTGSKYETKRLCKTLGATALVRLGKPLPEEIGYAESVYTEEIGGQKVIKIEVADSRIATIVVRGATQHLLDEIERAVDDAANLVRCVSRKDPRFVPGGGATEIELAHQLQQYGATVAGLEQYGVLRFAEAFEIVPKVLARNAGLNETKVIAALYAAHSTGQKNACVNLESTQPLDALQEGILDHLMTKSWAIRLGVDAALTVLRVDHIIVAKQAGGPPAQ